jgi:hypothetical protein
MEQSSLSLGEERLRVVEVEVKRRSGGLRLMDGRRRSRDWPSEAEGGGRVIWLVVGRVDGRVRRIETSGGEVVA